MHKIAEYMAVVVGAAALVTSGYIVGEMQGHSQATQTLERYKEQAKPRAFTPLDYLPLAIPDNGALAVRNRNPLNVKTPGAAVWAGQVGQDEFGHAIFQSWEHGVRAASCVLRAYAKKHAIDTVTGIVTRFAEGNRENYIKFVCKRLGVEPDEKISIIKRMADLLSAMARFECGQELPEELIIPYTVMEKL